MLFTREPGFCSTIFVDSWVRPDQSSSGWEQTPSAGALGLLVLRQGLVLLELGTEIYRDWLSHSCHGIHGAGFWSLGVGNNDGEVGQEYGPSKTEPHEPALYKDCRNDANHSYCHGN